jgi:hypothetical protein
MAVIGINYDGGNYHNYDGIEIQCDIKYESVYLHTSTGDFIFDSGDFVKDWFLAKRKFIKEISYYDQTFCDSSSVNHFIMHGASFDSAYLHTDDEGNSRLEYQYDEDGWEFFVKEGTKPTWEELKNYCKEE